MINKYLTVAALIVLSVTQGCSSDRILKVTDPDIITPEQANSPAGAEGLRVGVLVRLAQATSGPVSNGDSPMFLGALLTDEYRSSDVFTERDEIDRRATQTSNAVLSNSYRALHRARVSADQAIAALKQYSPTRTAEIAQMYWVRGFMENQSGEDFCNGQIFSTSVAATGELIYGSPVSYNEAFNRAIASFDSSLAVNTGTGTLATLMRQAATLGKARALLNLGSYSAAGALVTTAAVPSTFKYQVTHSAETIDNQWWALGTISGRYNVGNIEGTNGLRYRTANDGRLPTCTGGSAACVAVGAATFPFDFRTASLPLTVNLRNARRDSAVTISSGAEARLIEAEAALQASNTTLFLTKINEARQTFGNNASGSRVAADTTLPGTATGQQNLLFYERAFTLFATGHRLGDLRRLIRQYGRGSETVFPTGSYTRLTGTTYGTDVNLPIPITEANNPNYAGCTDRNP